MRIWKYNLNVTDSQTLTMPQGATILCVALQDGGPVLWAAVDENADKVTRRIEMICTGNQVPTELVGKFIGTVLMLSGRFVAHFFDGGEV